MARAQCARRGARGAQARVGSPDGEAEEDDAEEVDAEGIAQDEGDDGEHEEEEEEEDIEACEENEEEEEAEDEDEDEVESEEEDDDDDDLYVVKAIHARRGKGKNIQYRVEWEIDGSMTWGGGGT